MIHKVLGAALVLALASACYAESTFGEIAGNVPTVSYDNADRMYTQIVIPPGGGGQLGQMVINAVAGDPTVRQNSIVRVNIADANFQYRWGNSFYEASQGIPTVALIRETAGRFTSVYKMPISSDSDLSRELPRLTQALLSLDLKCPNCPNPLKPPVSPSTPSTPSQPQQPTLPPIPNTPPGTAPEENDPVLMVLAIGAGLFIGWAVVFKRGMPV